MRKFLFVTPIFLVGLLSCQKEMLNSNVQEMDGDAITAYAPEDSKVSVNGLNVTWCEGDKLAVIGKNDPDVKSVKYYHLEAGAGSKTAVFKPDGDACTDANLFAITNALAGEASGTTHWFFKIPSVQNYVEGKVADNILPLFCFSPKENLQFKHLAAVIKVSFWSKEAKQISRVVMENDNVVAGDFYFDPIITWGSYKGVISGNTTKAVTLECNGQAIGTTEASPTDFYFVVGTDSNFKKTLKNLKFIVYTTDGKVCSLTKTSPVTCIAGEKVVFSAPRECVFSASSVEIKLDDNDWAPWPMGGIVATNSIKVRTGEEKMTESQFQEILDACVAAEGPLSLDFSEALWQQTDLGNNFCGTDVAKGKIKSFVFPKNLGSFGYGCLFYRSGLEKVSIPSSTKSIGVGLGCCCSSGPVAYETYDVEGKSKNFGVIDGMLCKLDDGGLPVTLYTISNAKTLTSLVLPETITTTAGDCFDDCANLKFLVLPAQLSSVGTNGISRMYRLETIRFKGNTPPSSFPSSVGNLGYYAPEGSRKVYVNDLADWEDSNVYKALYTNATYKYTFEEWDDALSAGIPDLK